MASTSNHQIPSSSTSPPPLTQWDVFLSFRGEDTRYTFTDHLYKDLHRSGIRTFRDDLELHSGEVISDSLIQTIRNSKTYIVVFSENYAASSWCLDELVEILDCYNRMNRLVIPVFHYVLPSDVRHLQMKSFVEAFEKHQTRYDEEKVKKWRLTMMQVAGFSGYHICKNSSQADIVDKVVDRVLLKTNPRTLDVAKYPVGLDSRVEGVKALFDSGTGSVIRVGIHGMGGVGKTTLAKAVYNQYYRQFPGSCFLANVREVSRTKGLVCLQQQLINDVLSRKDVKVDSVDQGIELIRARIGLTKVLIVIDDIDDPKLLKYLEGSLALGSIVIITTRNEDFLDKIQVKAKYKVNQMDQDESHQLFTQHALGQDNMSHTFSELSKEILEHTGGLPLALQVFGSTLLNESEDGWRCFIDKLKRAPICDVEENLMISFDALKSVDPDLQDIFLDIACWYIGLKKNKVSRILETCYTFVNHKIDILKKRCLIMMNDKDEMWMHDLLRDMGRGIARNNVRDEPGEHSRLWDLADIYNVLKREKGTKAIKGIIAKYSTRFLEDANGISFTAEAFKSMSKLRILYLNNVNISGSFEDTFEDLRWLFWRNCPLKFFPSGFYPINLVTLELPMSKMRTDWELNMVSQVFKNLKTLNMAASLDLTKTPDFTNFPCLETLNFDFCKSLEEVHISIGSLVRLVSLKLRGCALRSLPDNICSLRALEHLSLGGCNGLQSLPAELGDIGSLKELNVSGASVSNLPVSMGRLSNLVVLNLSDNEKLETLPDSICNLESLGILNIRNCWNLLSIPELPHNLKWIEATGCESLQRLPNLSVLKRLEKLELAYCSGLTVIMGLKDLTSLKALYLEGNSSLQAYILTRCFFQIFSGFGHPFQIHVERAKFPCWISQSSEYFSPMSFYLQPNTFKNFLAVILCIDATSLRATYEVINIRSGLRCIDTTFGNGASVIIVPSSILSIEEGDYDFEVRLSEAKICGICLLCQKEDPIEENGSTDLNVEEEKSSTPFTVNIEERRNPSYNDIESYENRFSLRRRGTTVNIEEERRDPSNNDIESDKNRLSLWRSGTTVNAGEKRSNPLVSDLESNKNWLSSWSNTVNVEEDRRNPSNNDIESDKKRLSLGRSSTSFNVGEKRSNPLVSDLESNKNRLSSWSNTVNVEEERGKPSDNDMESNEDWFLLALRGTTVNVGGKRRKPSDSDMESNTNWLSLGKRGATVNVGEKRSNPLVSDLESNKDQLSFGSSSNTGQCRKES